MPNFNFIKKNIPEYKFYSNILKSKFDLNDEKLVEIFKGNIDIDNKEWNIGLICGNSGTGKSSIINELYKDKIFKYEYKEKCLIDEFRKYDFDEVTKILNSVGFSSPPCWLKPYSVLSNGQKARVDIAMAILQNNDIIVIDEFTSVVDRDVAKIMSNAIQKTIKNSNKKIIFVSCHFDIIEWLLPDWIFNTNDFIFKYTRGLLRRPDIKLDFYKKKGFWNLFKKYHYLDNSIHKSASEFIMIYNNKIIGFLALLPFAGKKACKRVSRLVILPDYQGIGLGKIFLNFIAEKLKTFNNKLYLTTSNPMMFLKDKKWKLLRCSRNRQESNTKKTGMKSTNRTNCYTKGYVYL